MTAAALAALTKQPGPPAPEPPLLMRSPLTGFPQPYNYEHLLPFKPPAGPDLYFHRGQFCGLRVAGAPVVPGSNALNPECVMAALLDNYPDWVVDEFLRLYCGFRYSHLQRSLGHALYYTSIERHEAVSRQARSFGLFMDEWLIANEFPGFAFNQGIEFWQPKLEPYIDRLLGEGLIQLACPSWQMDQVMEGAPGNPTIGIIAWVAEKLPQAVPIYTHWMRDALAWWKTGGETWVDPKHWPAGIFVHDRFSWWVCMQPYLTGAHHQGNTTMARTDPGTYQGHLRDTLNPFNDGRMGVSRRAGRGVPFAMTVYECTAQDQFGNSGQTSGFCTEDEGDRVGYTLLCTTSDGGTGGTMAGYGNGARMPDGSPL